jgi:hypothetical protein
MSRACLFLIVALLAVGSGSFSLFLYVPFFFFRAGKKLRFQKGPIRIPFVAKAREAASDAARSVTRVASETSKRAGQSASVEGKKLGKKASSVSKKTGKELSNASKRAQKLLKGAGRKFTLEEIIYAVQGVGKAVSLFKQLKSMKARNCFSFSCNHVFLKTKTTADPFKKFSGVDQVQKRIEKLVEKSVSGRATELIQAKVDQLENALKKKILGSEFSNILNQLLNFPKSVNDIRSA